MPSRLPIINRELSWLSFNERVLQEAESTDVPVLERLKFLGIYSNNLDEFFRVRIATIKRMMDFDKRAKQELGFSPSKIMDAIQEKLKVLQKKYAKAYENIIKALEKENIFILNETQLDKQQGIFVKNYFQEKVRLEIFPIMLDKAKEFPILLDASIYLAVRFSKNKTKETHYALIEVPTSSLSRFVVLPAKKEKQYILFLDDVIRYNLKSIFQIYDFDKIEAYTIKFTRDAELDVDNDVSLTFMESMEMSLKKRKHADALRFVYDAQMPKDFQNYLIKKMELDSNVQLYAGARYHNFKDFIKFPSLGKSHLLNAAQQHIPHHDLEKTRSILDKMKLKDILLYFPYHSFDYFLDLLREAAIDPNVSHIRITLYRVASQSHVIKSLITALHNGKDVTVFIEIRARFDEEANLDWANKLREAGARIIPGISGLKVHSKLCLITRREKGNKVYYACIGTGNLHEKTARIYTDAMVLTCNQTITKEARQIFSFFDKNYSVPKFNQLLVAPFNLRSKLTTLINKEIKNAKAGKKAEIFLKLNNLVDEDVIERLYNASKAGVKIRLIVRGINSLVPQFSGFSENIEAISIVDKFLEHTRIFVFHNDGKPEVFIGSADLMTRNLDFRIEVVLPIIDEKIKKQLLKIMELQWKDNVKSRWFDEGQKNIFKIKTEQEAVLRSQDAIYDFWKSLSEKKK
ncbi:MAG TPA: polyphosphate kinase 1 [Chitinophagales bacterium]|nr:polyphosphate kinase 1 [Chitinophagales bacterium]HMZ34793.1 polyphosphate kinase 1 [Chitinophagales bacterium]HNA39060.1 polyphosphate kinase 1 [Chitinophagales bacterium]HNB47902.1 polyphosphate kinase 1 [Chitinophagales bacterium]HNF18630.1 polyphosphate kinase 1 [Chitinophagales bacterium]